MTPVPDSAAPTVRDLTRAECEEVLARNHVGRIAFSYHDHVDIEPIHYVYADGWIYGRTAPGSKLRTLAHNRWLAFETDEVEGAFAWRSVVIKGALYLLEPTSSPSGVYELALSKVRQLIPSALSEADPSPNRNVVFRIHVDQLTGRMAGVNG